jgi:type IV pilus assembly protein PilE
MLSQLQPPRRQGGFSLTELLIVVVIVGVLAAIGVPAYQNYARASKRADAQQSLLRMAQLQERYFTERNAYSANTSTLGYAPLNGDANLAESTDGYWMLDVTAGGGAAFALRARPLPPHTDPECASISLDSAGVRGGAPDADCWSMR